MMVGGTMERGTTWQMLRLLSKKLLAACASGTESSCAERWNKCFSRPVVGVLTVAPRNSVVAMIPSNSIYPEDQVTPPTRTVRPYHPSTMWPAFHLDTEPTEHVLDDAFFGSPELEGTISLETAIGNSYVVDQVALFAAWEQLSAVSVEAASLGRPDLFEFAANRSLLFAAIRTPVALSISTGVDVGKLDLSDEAAVISTDSPVLPSDPSAIYDLVTRYYRQMHPESPSDQGDDCMGSSSSDSPPQKKVFKWETIGIVYVTMSPLPHEVHVGVGLLPAFRGRGAGIKACAFAVQWAIETIAAHRVQARILASPDRSRTQRLFTALGFTHEGTQRRAVPDATGAWVDVTCMGVVDTDWIVRRRLRAVPRNMWDELFARHQREREELLLWEESQGRMGLRRSSSMETVRGGDGLAFTIPEVLSEDESASGCGASTPSTSSSSSYRSISPKPAEDEADACSDRSWRSPVSVPNADSSDPDDPFSDNEWIVDILHSSEEPISRPVSPASWSSFESIGSASSPTALTEDMSGMAM